MREERETGREGEGNKGNESGEEEGRGAKNRERERGY